MPKHEIRRVQSGIFKGDFTRLVAGFPTITMLTSDKDAELKAAKMETPMQDGTLHTVVYIETRNDKIWIEI